MKCPICKKDVTLEGTYDELSAAFQKLVDDYIATKYTKREHPLPEVNVPPSAAAAAAKSALRVLA